MIVQYLGQRDDTFEGRGGLLVLRCQPLTVATPARQDSHTSCLSNQITSTCQPVENKEKDHNQEQETSTLYLPYAHQIPSLKVYFFFRSNSFEWKLCL